VAAADRDQGGDQPGVDRAGAEVAALRRREQDAPVGEQLANRRR